MGIIEVKPKEVERETSLLIHPCHLLTALVRGKKQSLRFSTAYSIHSFAQPTYNSL